MKLRSHLVALVVVAVLPVLVFTLVMVLVFVAKRTRASKSLHIYFV